MSSELVTIEMLDPIDSLPSRYRDVAEWSTNEYSLCFTDKMGGRHIVAHQPYHVIYQAATEAKAEGE